MKTIICKICKEETDIEVDGVCEDYLKDLEEDIEDLNHREYPANPKEAK